MSDAPQMIQQEEWRSEFAQMVASVVGAHEGPIQVYAEDFLGGVMETAVTFRRGERLIALNFLEPEEQEILFKVQSLYQQSGGRDGDVRAVRVIIDEDNISVQVFSANDIGLSDGLSFGFRSRLSSHTIEAFGRDWREGDGDRPEILQLLDQRNNRRRH